MTHYPLLAAGADFDYTKVIFAVVFLVVAFVQWLIKLGKAEIAKREIPKRPPLSEEEKEMRRRAMERNLGTPTAQPPPMPPTLSQPAAARAARKPAANSHAGTIGTSSIGSTVTSTGHLGKQTPATQASSFTSIPAPAAKRAHPLVKVLSSAGAARQAVLMKEILGPPKALQSDADALF
jgi:hypothetical protein